MAMTKEVRRTLTTEMIIADTRDKRIAWAVRALEMGASPAPNPCTLALLSVERVPNPWEVDVLFERSIEELDLAISDREEALRQYARDVAEGVVSGYREPIAGAYELQAVAEELGYPEDMEPWGGFDEDLFLVVDADGDSLYYSGDDMISYIDEIARALLQKIPRKYF
jgi:hypothetical protein